MIKNVYEEMTSFESLRRAYKEVAKGKGDKLDTLRFEYDLEANLHDLSHALRHGQVPKVYYKSFYVFVPKVRKVIYIDFTSKIIQRAIYDCINPRLSKSFISDTYACIPGRGQLAAMLRVRQWMADTRFRPGDWHYFKFDVSKFFYRIDHGILLRLIKKKIADVRLVDLLQYYVCETGTPFGLPLDCDQLEIEPEDMLFDVGIPIGGGLSHTLGNLYLDPLDQYIKRTLNYGPYIRYMDDGLAFSNNKLQLKEDGKRMEEFLNENLALNFNSKTALRPVSSGVEFVGCNIYDDHVRLRKSTTLHMRRRLKNVQEQYHDGIITFQEANQTVQSYKAMLKHVDMDRFNQVIWDNFTLTKGGLDARQH